VLARLAQPDVGIDDLEAVLLHERVYTPPDWQRRYNVAKALPAAVLRVYFIQGLFYRSDEVLTRWPRAPRWRAGLHLRPQPQLLAGRLAPAAVRAPAVPQPLLRRPVRTRAIRRHP
jgi:hypothetical protein